MKPLIFLTALFFSNFIFSKLCLANETQLGVILGSTTGFSAKYDIGADHAIDGALSYSIDGKYGFSLHSDYLLNKERQFTIGKISPVNLYYGLGFRLLSIRSGTDNGNSKLGIRAPLGVHYRINRPDLEIFGELAPVLDVTPRTDIYINVGLGVRFIF